MRCYGNRYVALREVLLYHVGFEAIRGTSGEVLAYSMTEALNVDHHHSDYLSVRASALESGGMTKKQRRRYQGAGMFPAGVMAAVNNLLKKVLRSRMKAAPYYKLPPGVSVISSSPGRLLKIRTPEFIEDNILDDFGPIDPLHLAPVAVRALYALQLELDAYLPTKTCAQCRLWAEDRYRQTKVDVHVTSPTASSSAVPVGDVPSSMLLVAVLDVSNIKPTFGMSTVDAFCSVEAFKKDGGIVSATSTEVDS